MGEDVFDPIPLTPAHITSLRHQKIANILDNIKTRINEKDNVKSKTLYDAVTSLINGLGADYPIKPPPLKKGAVLRFGFLLKALWAHTDSTLGTSTTKAPALKKLEALLTAILKGIEEHVGGPAAEPAAEPAEAVTTAAVRKIRITANVSTTVSLGKRVGFTLGMVCAALGMSKEVSQEKVVEFLVNMTEDAEGVAWDGVSIALEKAVKTHSSPALCPPTPASQAHNTAKFTTLMASNAEAMGLTAPGVERAARESLLRQACSAAVKQYGHGSSPGVVVEGSTWIVSLEEMLRPTLVNFTKQAYPDSYLASQLLLAQEVLQASDPQLESLKGVIDLALARGQIVTNCDGTLLSHLAGNLLDRVTTVVDVFCTPYQFRNTDVNKLRAVGLPLEPGAAGTLISQLTDGCLVIENKARMRVSCAPRSDLGAQGYLAVEAFKWIANLASAHAQKKDGEKRAFLPRRDEEGRELVSTATTLPYGFLFLKGLAMASVGTLLMHLTPNMRTEMSTGDFLPPPLTESTGTNPFLVPISGRSVIGSGGNAGNGEGKRPREGGDGRGGYRAGNVGREADKGRGMRDVRDDDLSPEGLARRNANRKKRAMRNSGEGTSGSATGAALALGNEEDSIESPWFALRKIFVGKWNSTFTGCAFCGERHDAGRCTSKDAPTTTSQIFDYNCDGRNFVQIQDLLKKHTKAARARMGSRVQVAEVEQ